MENQNWGNAAFNPRQAAQPWGIPQQQMNIPQQQMNIPQQQMPPQMQQQMTMPQAMPAGLPPRPMLFSERLAERKKELVAFIRQYGLAGFQVTRREFMSHSFDPAMTARANSVTFNNACISRLEQAMYIQFLINPDLKALVIRPCSENARDAVRWCTKRQDKRKSREITCKEFTERLYELMGWEAAYHYKLQGFGIDVLGETLYMFDLKSDEHFLPSFKDPKSGKMVRPKVIRPEGWADSFGMPVEEHDKSTQVDVASGFIGMTEAKQGIGIPPTQGETEVTGDE